MTNENLALIGDISARIKDFVRDSINPKRGGKWEYSATDNGLKISGSGTTILLKENGKSSEPAAYEEEISLEKIDDEIKLSTRRRYFKKMDYYWSGSDAKVLAETNSDATTNLERIEKELHKETITLLKNLEDIASNPANLMNIVSK